MTVALLCPKCNRLIRECEAASDRPQLAEFKRRLNELYQEIGGTVWCWCGHQWRARGEVTS